MRTAFPVFVSVIVALSLGNRGAAQDDKKPDYTRKTAAQWIDVLLDEQDTARLDEARQALGPRGPYAKTAIALLIDALEKDESFDSPLVATLVDYGPAAVPDLMKALKRTHLGVRIRSVEALGKVRSKAKEAVPALIAVMGDTVPEVRMVATRSLGQIGQPIDKTVPALAAALKDEDQRVRMEAAQSLSRLGRRAGAAVPGLITALKDKEYNVRHEALRALRAIGPAAKAAVPTLIEALQDKKNGTDRYQIARVLGAIGPAAKEAVPTLVVALHDRDEWLPGYAAATLGEIGPEAKAAVPELLTLAKDKNNPARDEAITALGRIGSAAKAAVPTLIEALGKNESQGTSAVAAIALGEIGPEAKAALPALIALARNLEADYPPARQTAARAVMKIDPVLAAKENMEFAYLNVRLGKVAPLKPEPPVALTDVQKKRIKALIARLAQIEEPDFGLSATLTGSAFAPLSGHGQMQMGLLADHQLKTSGAFRSLVEIGPAALPFLLDALEDRTPTKLTVDPQFGTMFLGNELDGNPLNSREQRILSREAEQEEEHDLDDLMPKHYTLKVGDVCFVAIGQIVGRSYSAVRYQPTAMVIINSPIEWKDMRERVRAIWSSNDPSKKLLDSLLIDYATEGLYSGKSFNSWYDATPRQTEAALRLLYYFPKESAPLIAARLRSFDVRRYDNTNDWAKREVKNGVITADFIKAVSWSKAPGIPDALADIAKRTNDPDIVEVLPAKK